MYGFLAHVFPAISAYFHVCGGGSCGTTTSRTFGVPGLFREPLGVFDFPIRCDLTAMSFLENDISFTMFHPSYPIFSIF